ncbi:MAG: DUF2235 domain-containing protein, partial [Thioploca sp.]|nr:DUF2235 domain-containing protein [Thioploca sp.]
WIISDLDNKGLLSDAYALYRRRNPNPDVEDVQAFRKQYSYYDAAKENTGEPLETNPVKIKFLGVWDTVGALGIPIGVLSLVGCPDEEIKEIKSRQFHDVNLSALVENAFHALAIDEHRQDYEATLWNSAKKPHRQVEQVWFAGAHTDVGGGVAGYPLSKIALAWMQKKAIQCGLELDDSQLVTITQADNLAEIYDSFGEFLKGIYAKEHQRYYRNIGTQSKRFEAIHESVKFRLNADNQYRPQNKVGQHVSGRREEAKEEKL